MRGGGELVVATVWLRGRAVARATGEGAAKTTMVGRFGPRSKIRTGDVIDVAVDTAALHVFDLETSRGIYAQA